jgi:hypothetical protein
MAKKRASILGEYGKSKEGWTFLAGDEKAIAQVADAAGFGYQYDERQKQWAHPSVAMIVKPDGRMARYLYGFEFPSADLRLGLLEASEGRSISTVEQIILYCYHYDPQGGKYVLVARRVMQVGGGAVAIVLFSVLGLFWTRELVKHRSRRTPSGGPDGGSKKDSHPDQGDQDEDHRSALRASQPSPAPAASPARAASSGTASSGTASWASESARSSHPAKRREAAPSAPDLPDLPVSNPRDAALEEAAQ